jgi:D-lactate dehydrogenase
MESAAGEIVMDRLRELSGLLGETHCFSGLDKTSIAALAGRFKLLKVTGGEKICAEGDPGDSIYLIGSGAISVVKRDESGCEVEIAVLRRGEIAGEMSLFNEHTRTSALVAKEPADLWRLEHADLKAAIDDQPSIAWGMLATLGGRLSRGTSLLAKVLSRDIDRRFKVAVFNSKPYMEKALREANIHNYALRFFSDCLQPETVALAAGCDAVCIFVNDNVNADVATELAAMHVRMIALRCAGFNNVELGACARHGITVARVPAYSPHAVAEHAIALMLTLNRKTHRAHNRVREGDFSLDGLVGFDMHGRVAGLIGAGKIGVCAMEILRGFGCRILVHSRTTYPELTERFGAEFVPLDELLSRSDIISLHAPLTRETHHLINAATISLMKPGVMLVNTSRGGLIDTRALIEGLKNGTIGAAGLDVYEEEGDYFFNDYSDRVMADDVLARLTTFNNVLVTSHQAFLTSNALAGIAETTIANIREFECGKRGAELRNAVAPRAE